MKKKKEDSTPLNKEELQKQLKRKSSALDRFKRESKIEAALESVRSRALAMHKSDELSEVVTVVFEKLQELDFSIDGAAFITTYIENTRESNVWIGDDHGQAYKSSFRQPYYDSPQIKDLWNAREQGLDFQSKVYPFEEKNKCFRYVFEHTDMKILADELKEWILLQPCLTQAFAMAKNSGIGIHYHYKKNLTAKEKDILKRFSKVFDQAYIRFLDLQKAEALAREAQIELGLERVRARAMAMQKSGELSELVDTVFKELTKLDFALTWCIINIIDESSMSNTVWAANPDINKAPESYHMLFDDYPFHHALMQGWKERKTKCVYTLEGNEKKVYDEYLFRETEFRRTPEAAQAVSRAMEKYVVSFSFSNFGGLQTVGDVPLSDANLDILSRFGKVFDLTYTRFNDLKQAEAQARESQIQLALERVRARTMAMQKSDELSETASLLFKQVSALGIQLWSTAFQIWNADDISTTAWPSAPDGSIQSPFRLPYNEDIFFKRIYEARQSGTDFFAMESSGKELEETYHYMFNLPGVKKYFDDAQDLGFIIPKYQVTHCAFFAQGYLMFITYEPVPGAHDIFKRFGAVFEQTYTRFLDLQKAEEQARESQIQLALERVRARTMAMQKHSDLLELTSVLAEQLSQLDFKIDVANFSDGIEEEYWDLWISTPGSAFPPMKVYFPSLPIAFFEVTKFAIREFKNDPSKDFSTGQFGKEDKDAFVQLIFEHTVFGQAPQESKEMLLGKPGYGWSTIYLRGTWLSIGNFDGVPYSEEQNAIIRRFGKAFEQAYIRFLDLQNAEAQARESQIQLALERVRARTMAMQRSDELIDAASVLFKQLKELGVDCWSSGFNVWEPDGKSAIINMCNPDGSIGTPYHLPHNEDIFFVRICEARQRGDELLVMETGGKELEETYNYMFSLPHVSKMFGDMVSTGFPIPKFQVNYCAFFTQGYLMFITYEPVPEMCDLFKRFAKVFEQTYTRFLDLQNAEALAREAQIQLALERVRARTMAMQHSSELPETATLLFQQLKELGFDSWATAFCLWTSDDDLLEVWSSAGEGTLLPSMILPHKEDPTHLHIYEAHLRGETFYEEENGGEALAKHYEWMMSVPSVKKAFSILGDSGHEPPTRQYYYVAFFKQGYLLILTKEPRADASDLSKRFAKVFEQTYTRFLDLQKAEAQTREAQIQLALERVRARMMAMQKSDELAEAARLLYEEFRTLNISTFLCGYCFYKEEQDKQTVWVTLPDGTLIPDFTDFPITGDHVLNERYEDWKQKKPLHILEIIGEDNKEHHRFLASKVTDRAVNEIFAQIPERIIIYCANFSTGYLFIIATEFLTGEEENVIIRFAKVFELTYTRFSDLKQAELQTREAQIQLALERIRARTMAMQHSDELKNAAALLFQQVKSLGAPAYSCGYNIWGKDDKEFTSWMSVQDGSEINGVPNISLTEDANFIRYVESKQNGEQFFVLELRGERMQEHYEYLKTIPAFKGYFEYAISVGFDLPATQIHHLANFSNGNLLFITLEPCPEFHDVFRRFAAVFEQTYTRFLDLQKAEEQAREAKIEASLERVRASAMAMHHSDELSDVLSILFQQFDVLGIRPVDAHLDLFDWGKNTFTYRATGKEGKRVIAEQIVDLDSREEWKTLAEKWKRSKPNAIDFSYYPKEVIRELMAFFPDIWAAMPEEAIMSPEDFPDGMYDTLGYCKFGYIGFHHYRKATEEEKVVLIRFANEFERLYQRFLDLQKAEAQARESNIQLALERVRARTMAMQKSDELPQAANLLFQQVQSLGMPAWSAGYCIWDDDKKAITLSMSSEGVLQPTLRMPLTEDPSLMHFVEAHQRGETFFVEEVGGEALKSHYVYLRTLPGVKETLDDIEKAGFPVPTFQIFHCAYFSKGFLLFITYEPVPEAHDTFKRFGKVFDQTYTRFLDLQKAEAQARESQIQLALERVRARTMAMQKSDELPETSFLLFQQVKELGETASQFSIGIFKEETGNVELSTTIHGRHLPYTVNVPINEPYVMAKAVAAWKANRKSLKVEFERHEMKGYNEWRNTILGTKMNFLEEQWIINLIFFSKGWLSFSSDKNISAETFGLLKRFAAVFEQTYIRFNDLKQAEEQARESQIEAALERVRSRSMGMQKSEELQEVIQVVYEQFVHLNINVEHTGFVMDYKARDDYDIWIADQLGVPSHLTIPYFDCVYYNRFNEAKKNGEDFFATNLDFEEKNRFYQKIIENVPGLPEETKAFLFSIPGLAGSTVLLDNVGLYIENFAGTPYSDEENNTLMRFGKVFQQTYTRFLDLQKVEAQSREGQIELALERVRARTMAMQRSDELREAVLVIYEQLQHLDFESKACNIIIIDKESSSAQYWVSGFSQEIFPESYTVPYLNHPYQDALLNPWKQGDKYVVYEYAGQMKQRFDEIFFTQTEFKNIPEDAKKVMIGLASVILSTAYISYGALQSIGTEPLSEEKASILKRFAKVFEQTYTRFLDLQKSEAQAREAHIEAALEKVRSRSLAMHTANELGEVVTVIVEKLKDLGVVLDANGVVLCTYFQHSKDVMHWIVSPDYSMAGSYLLPYFDHPIFNAAWQSKENGDEYFSRAFSVMEKNSFFEYAFEHSDYRHFPDEFKQWIFQNDQHILSFAWQKNSAILIPSHTGVLPSEQDIAILKRFAKVFEQSYVRFLDLQKAEVQARESQIQLALERVRARTMAMQKSNELQQVVNSVYERLNELEVEIDGAAICTFIEGTKDYNVWIGDYQEPLRIKFNEFTQVQRDYNDAIERREELFTNTYSGEIKKEYIQFLLEQTDLGINIPEEQKRLLLASAFFTTSLACTKNTVFQLYRYTAKSFSKEENNILSRFAKVFEQSYVRFLDLQKAEVQARESQIQLALERVRARTMAMHHSGELADTASVLFQQIKELGFETWSCGFCTWTNNDLIEVWMAADSGGLLPPMMIPYKAEPTHSRIYEASLRGETAYDKVWEGKELESHYAFLKTIPSINEAIEILENSGLSLPSRQCYYVGFFKQGYLLLITKDPNAELKDLSRRFARVFTQTYTRFLDLQKAEAQAKESQIQLALERVRARTMAMQRSDELQDAASLMVQQIQALGVPQFGSGFNIWDDDRKAATAWMCNVTTDNLPPPFKTSSSEDIFLDIHDAAERGEALFVKEQAGKELETHYKYMNSIPVFREYVESASAEGLSIPNFQIMHCAFFSQGYLMFITYEPVPEAYDIFKRFAKVFEQTYTRFLDLQKAEAQAREAQIEAALERIRSRTMGMQRSEELPEVATLLFQQVKALGVTQWTCGFGIFEIDDKDFTWYQGGEDGAILPPCTIPLTEHPVFMQFNEARKRGDELYIYEKTGELQADHYRYMCSLPVLGKLMQDRLDAGRQFPAFQVDHVASFSHGNLVFITYQHVPEMHDVFKRLAKVFDLTYTRFLDLQKAEAQAREARIEAALERVRSRTMAMQKSNELAEVAMALFQQVKELGIKAWTTGFNVWQEDNASYIDWVTSPNGEFLEPYTVDLTAHPALGAVREAKQRGDDFFVSHFEGEQIVEAYELLSSFADKGQYQKKILDAGFQFPTQQFNHFVFGAQVSLLFITYEPCPEAWDIFKRFGKVFEQTYTRFLDLQKAEAQAREARIEAALERVRSRTMAMQRSEELAEVATLLFQQVKALGVSQWVCGFCIWEIGDKEFTWYPGSPDGEILAPCKVPLTEHPVFISMNESRLRGDELFVYEKEGEFQADHYRYMISVPGMRKQLQAFLDAGLSIPTFQIDHLANFSHGNLTFITYEHFPEMHDIFKRFAKVFDLTYTRFLDLQKAEAQAREARIEAALEKIRSTSLGMHRSDEIMDVVNILFEKLKELELIFDGGAAIHLFAEGSRDARICVVSPLRSVPVINDLPYDEEAFENNPIILDVWKAKDEGVDIINKYYSFEQKNRYFEYVFKYNDKIKLPETVRDFIFKTESYTATFIAEKNSLLGANSWTGQIFSETDLAVLKRVARVFEQAYVRFLDLKKAEGQAREAQIEAALEKVRAKVMAMTNSKDLNETSLVFGEQLRKLNIDWQFSYFWLVDESKNENTFWITWPDYKTSFTSYTLAEAEEYFNDCLVSWRAGVKIHDNFVPPERVQSWLDTYQRIADDAGGEAKKVMVPGTFPNGVYYYDAIMKYGSFGICVNKSATGEEKNIQCRFAIEFERAYTRFLDLQRAETQAREAIKQASVDRVRAEIASMRTTNDLERITPLVWNELTTLGVPFIRCGVFIMDDEREEVQSFLSTPDGKAIAAFRQPYSSPGEISEMVESWHKKVPYKQHWDEARFVEFTKGLMEQGAVTSGEKYLTEIRPTDLYLHFIPFLQGMLYAGNTAPLSDDELQLVQNLADAFSTAYARYEDFNKLEHAKQQVDKALVDLKQAQQQLVQSEKMASLGELTAGIAHEIQNPLNFVNNFSEVNTELIHELYEELEKGNMEQVGAIAASLRENEEKIAHHGKRADAIVRGMLQHSRASTGQKEPTDINTLADEYLRLSYHGMRAKDKSFNAEIQIDFDDAIGKVNIIRQDMGRVLLNLYNNAFYAVAQRKKTDTDAYKPLVSISTKKIGEEVEISVTDNGTGIPEKIKDKIFQPFFTTKPTGQGTGLGLSLSYDIVKAHGGALKVETKESEGTEFVVQLPV